MIELKNVSVRRNGRDVLRDLSATFEAGQLVAIVGPNGAGKSTLLQVLSKLIENASGQIELDQRALTTFERGTLARRIAYLPQDHHVSWPVSVRHVVELGRMPYVSTLTRIAEVDRNHIESAMKAMSVTHLADRPATTLSGGELARVLVARLLAQDTPYILADEPAAGLDPAHALGLFEHFRALGAAGRLVLVAMHDLSFALRFCDRALLLNQGRAEAFGPVRDVLTRDHVAAVYGVRAAIGEVDGLPVVVPSQPMPS